MKIRFTIRDAFLATAIVALLVGWWIDRRRLAEKIDQLSPLVQPAAVIEGHVIYGAAVTPAVGVQMHAQAISTFVAGHRAGYGSAKTDDEGRYRFVNLAPGNYNIWAELDGWTMDAINSLPVVAGQTVKGADLRLVKGGFLKGRVVDEETERPIAAVDGRQIMIGVYGPARPRTGGAVEGVVVDSKGEFQIRVPPGRNYPYVMSAVPGSVLQGFEYQQEGVLVEDGKTAEIEFSIKVKSANQPSAPAQH